MTLDLVWFFVCFDLKTQARLNALKIFVSSIRTIRLSLNTFRFPAPFGTHKRH